MAETQNSEERTIRLAEPSPTEARSKAIGMALESPMAGLEKSVPDFKKVNTKSFRAEYDIIEGNVVVHFFLPVQADQHIKSPNGRAAWMKYWLEKFPAHLDVVAKKHFDAEYPRLQAKYTEEMASWWLRAQGYGRLLNPKKFMETFFDLLDAALQERT